MSFFKRLVPLKARMTMNLENVSVAEGTPFKGSATLSSDDNFQRSGDVVPERIL